MSLSAYLIFSTVSEQQSIIRASEVLHITPSAISHSISKLEQDFGIQLLHRGRGSNEIRLTTNGKIVLKRVQTILEEEKSLREEISSIKSLLSGTVTISAINSICVAWIPNLIYQFNEIHPTITIRILQGGYNFAEDMVYNGLADFGFLSCPTLNSNSFQHHVLYHDPIYCLAPPNFCPINETYVVSEDFLQMPFLLAHNSYDRLTLDYLNKHKISANLFHETSTDASTIALVERGLGISLLPKLVIDTERPTKCKLFPIEGFPYREISISTLKNHVLSPAAKCFFLFIKEHINLLSFE